MTIGLKEKIEFLGWTTLLLGMIVIHSLISTFRKPPDE